MTEAASPRAIPIERIVSLHPFVVRRRIAFRDCDPAGIVYTPRFFDPIATSAVDLFMMEQIGPPGERDEGFDGLGFPAKAVSFVFHKGVRLGATVDIAVAPANIGETSVTLDLKCHDAAGVLLFEASLTLVCIDSKTFIATPTPDALRSKFRAYSSI
ncbi:MAG: hypothetical protein AAGC95_02360 [Pseudomonadota bacterium]